MGSKFHFSQWKIHFSQFIFIDKYLKSTEIEYFIHYLMWPVLFYVNSHYFQQWNSNWHMVFLNSSLDSKLRFFNVGLQAVFHQKKKKKKKKLGFLNVALVGLLISFPTHEIDEIMTCTHPPSSLRQGWGMVLKILEKYLLGVRNFYLFWWGGGGG